MFLLGIPAAALAVLAYQSRKTRPKDQTYYETLIDTAWQSSDRIQAELDREQGRREQLEAELDKEHDRAKALIGDLRDQLTRCKQRCALLEAQLEVARREEAAAREESGSLRRALRRWQGGEGEAGA
jgi:hypothetical protein